MWALPRASDFDQIRAKVATHLSQGKAENRLPHANQLWMLVGFQLFQSLSEKYACIEVFPQATIRAIGVGKIHKLKRGAIEAQCLAVSRHTGWPSEWKKDPPLKSIAWAPQHDCLDAYLSAWVAALSEEDRVGYGDPPEDVIWIPRIEEVYSTSESSPKPQRRSKSVRKKAATNTDRVCPACGKKVFRKWPLGWDAHAANKCEGLSAADPTSRKNEFERRFLNAP